MPIETSPRRRGRARIFACLLLLVVGAPLHAAPWAEVGDRVLRSDIEVLAARGLISGPTTTWPMPVGFFSNLRDEALLAKQPEFVRLAAYRVLDRLGGRNAHQGLKAATELRFASEPNLVRDYGSTARDQLDARVGLDYDSDRVAGSLRAGALSRLDGSGAKLAFDGSYLTFLAGNWQIYGGLVDKWYGPGWTSSLILSNNARPFPKIGLLRNNPHAFESRWLSWLGTYQIDFFLGLLEEDSRRNRNTPVTSLRISLMPVRGLELAVTRLSEFCGSGLPCKPLRAEFAFGNTNANRNFNNDEAAFEIKYTHDFNVLSVSPYLQIMNDDTGPFTHSYESYLGGVSWAGPWNKDGAQWRLTAEYTDSRATLDAFSFGSAQRVVGAAYNNDQYADGYRYRGRTIGFSQDSDSTLFSLAGSLTDTRGWNYRLVYYNAHINTQELAAVQASGSPFRNVVSAQPVTVDQLEAGVTIPYHNFRFELLVRGQDERAFPGTSGQINVEAGIGYRF